MADRAFKSNIKHLFEDLVVLSLRATIGATGAVTIDATKSPGIASITRNGVGDYTVVFSDKYGYLFGIFPTIQDSVDNAAYQFIVDEAGTDVDAAAPAVQINFFDEAGAVELQDGAVLKLLIFLSNTSEVFR